MEVHGISATPDIIELALGTTLQMPPDMRFIGTGWFISTDRRGSVVATAGHVCEGESSYQVVDIRGTKYPATRVYSDTPADVCLLYVTTPNTRTFRITGWDSTDIPFGLPVWYVGFPQEHRVAFDGRISGIREGNDDDRDKIIMSLDVNPGASGSPVIFDGRVVAMAVRYYSGFHSLSYGVAPEDLRRAQLQADNILEHARRTNTDPPGI